MPYDTGFALNTSEGDKKNSSRDAPWYCHCSERPILITHGASIAAARDLVAHVVTIDRRLTEPTRGGGFGSEGSAAAASGRSDVSTQVSEVVAFRREKTAGDVSSGFNKMERAKRLELNAAKPETPEQSAVTKSANAADKQLSTHAAELVEIATAWPGLSREIQTAVLTLIRVASTKMRSH